MDNTKKFAKPFLLLALFIIFCCQGCGQNQNTHEAKIDSGIVKPMPDAWPECFCHEFWLPNNGPLAVVYYRISQDGGKQLLARQIGGGSEDSMLFDVDGDGVHELICQNHSPLGWHPWVSIFRLSTDGSEVCEGEDLLGALQASFKFKLADIPWAGNLTLELDKKTKSLSGGEGVKWIASGPEVKVDGQEARMERIFLEGLRNITIPFKHVEPSLFDEICRPEDL